MRQREKKRIKKSDIQAGTEVRTWTLLNPGSPQGHWFAAGTSPPFENCWYDRHSLHLAAISSSSAGWTSCRSARRGIEPASPVGTNEDGSRLPTARRRDRASANVRWYASPRARRFRGATRYRRLAREVSTAGRFPRLGGRLLRRASSSRVRARLGSVVGRFGCAKRVPGRYPPIRTRGICARSSLYGLRGLRSRRARIEPRVTAWFATFGETDRLRVSAVFGLSFRAGFGRPSFRTRVRPKIERSLQPPSSRKRP